MAIDVPAGSACGPRRTSDVTRALASLLALCFVSGPAGIHPRTALAASGPESQAEDPLAEAQRLYQEGRARFDTIDYLGAIDLWTKAYALVRESEETQEIRAALVYNIASARVEAYKVDGEIRHLHQAKFLLKKYLREFDEIHGSGSWDSFEESAKITKKLQEIDAQIEKAKAGEEPKAAEEATPAVPKTQPGVHPEQRDRPKRGPLAIAGIAVASSAAIPLGVMIAGLVRGQRLEDDFQQEDADRHEIDRQGANANKLAIAGGVLTGVMVVAGVVLVIVDKKRSGGRKSRVAWDGEGRWGIAF